MAIRVTNYPQVHPVFQNSTRPCSFFFFFTSIYFLRDIERQSTSWGGAEREGDTESEAGYRLRAVSPEPVAGLELTNGEITT